MIINKLEMFNFRQYIGHQEVEFSTDPEKNVTVLIGVNTSGKTTIVRAFEWCLYGKTGCFRFGFRTLHFETDDW